MDLTLRSLKVKIKGISPLLMANNQAANPLNEYKKAKEAITSKRKKTDEDHMTLSKLDFLSHLYHTEEDGPVIRNDMIEAVIKKGASLVKRGSGKEIEGGMIVEPLHIPLKYEGPRTPDEMFDFPSGMFKDVRIGRNPTTKGQILITRPRFNSWSLEFEIKYYPETVDINAILGALERGGQLAGIGTYRPKYGRFVVVSTSDE